MRILVRRENPHPGAQLSLFEQHEGKRYQVTATSTPGGQVQFLEARHRTQARVEARIRCGKATGLRHLPSRNYQVNTAWCQAASIACDLLAWLRLLALDGDLATAEPKTLRYRDPARRRADRERPAPPLPADTAVMAMGPPHHRSVHPDPGPAAAMTRPAPAPQPRKENHQPGRGTGAHPTRQPGRHPTPHTRKTKINNSARQTIRPGRHTREGLRLKPMALSSGPSQALRRGIRWPPWNGRGNGHAKKYGRPANSPRPAPSGTGISKHAPLGGATMNIAGAHSHGRVQREGESVRLVAVTRDFAAAF